MFEILWERKIYVFPQDVAECCFSLHDYPTQQKTRFNSFYRYFLAFLNVILFSRCLLQSRDSPGFQSWFPSGKEALSDDFERVLFGKKRAIEYFKDGNQMPLKITFYKIKYPGNSLAWGFDFSVPPPSNRIPFLTCIQFHLIFLAKCKRGYMYVPFADSHFFAKRGGSFAQSQKSTFYAKMQRCYSLRFSENTLQNN